MLVHQAVFEYNTPNVAASDVVTDFEGGGLIFPFFLAVQRVDGDTTGDVNTSGLVGDGTEGSLDSVINGLHQAWAKFNGERLACPSNGIADSQASY